MLKESAINVINHARPVPDLLNAQHALMAITNKVINVFQHVELDSMEIVPRNRVLLAQVLY